MVRTETKCSLRKGQFWKQSTYLWGC